MKTNYTFPEGFSNVADDLNIYHVTFTFHFLKGKQKQTRKARGVWSPYRKNAPTRAAQRAGVDMENVTRIDVRDMRAVGRVNAPGV